MTSSVSCLVVGHRAQNKTLCLVHNNGLSRNYMVVSNELEMWQKVINTFSFEGQCVLVLLDGADPGELKSQFDYHVCNYHKKKLWHDPILYLDLK